MLMQTHEARLSALREELKRRGLDGFIVPLCDEHMSEYVGAYAQRLGWLTGFGGSAGSAALMTEKGSGNGAAIFVDGRYTLQVREQVDGKLWDYESVPETSPAQWLTKNVKAGQKIGFDPWLHAFGQFEQLKKAVEKKGAELVAVEENPIDSVWQDQPEPSAAKAVPHPDEFAGEASSSKREAVAEWLNENGADAVVITALDSIAWLFNIRGSDVKRTPVALSFAVVKKDGSAELFIAPEKVSEDLPAHLGNRVSIRDRADFEAALGEYDGKTVAVDPTRAVAAIFVALLAGGARVIKATDPVVLPKACKNTAEVEGHKAAQHRDAAAVSSFLHWLSETAPKGEVTELSAAAKLQGCREDTGVLKDLSFDTISGAGPNGASPHYSVNEDSNRTLAPNSVYLVDSGGQYSDGTTDITRTVWVGPDEAPQSIKDRYTRVLKGHIALDRALFPKGTTGHQLDAFARQFLWQAGVDYAHGTGHGVGSFLGVHEGPQNISTRAVPQPLMPGMICSNEPGYYKAGEYGIRIENLVLVETREIEGAEREVMGFTTLTHVPIDRALIDVSMLTDDERAWMDAYHARCREIIAPQVSGDTLGWVEAQTAPLS
ncbi:Xaa-Pro aminopeptidase [Croceicoccus mobilis]|uniref:Xaa-Pro aminopeptidase n=2 Tax=Croceicoccus mobilis TaxID=1703339 RepID=A0A916Z1D8_9SPHN|nr:Xaa-Pro aminopeptidase [Croceicoccus mobilis]